MQYIPFTLKKHKYIHRSPLPIPFFNQVKYLGITLDKRLTILGRSLFKIKKKDIQIRHVKHAALGSFFYGPWLAVLNINGQLI